MLLSAYYSRFFAALSLTASAVFALSGCNNTTKIPAQLSQDSVQQPTSTVAATTLPALQAVVGDYASAGYAKRDQGYDWVGVRIKAQDNEAGNETDSKTNATNATNKTINIKVRARSDIKEPTCQFDGQATLMGQDEAHGIIFQSQVNDSTAFFQFKDDVLTIDSKDPYALNYFCSGGGSLAGKYQKLMAPITLE